jgi:hypothetical protein
VERLFVLMKQERPQLVWLSVHPTYLLGVRAGEVVGEGRVEEGGGVRGS